MRRRILERILADSAFKLMPPLMNASRTPATAQYKAQPIIQTFHSISIAIKIFHISYLFCIRPGRRPQRRVHTTSVLGVHPILTDAGITPPLRIYLWWNIFHISMEPPVSVTWLTRYNLGWSGNVVNTFPAAWLSAARKQRKQNGNRQQREAERNEEHGRFPFWWIDVAFRCESVQIERPTVIVFFVHYCASCVDAHRWVAMSGKVFSG